MEIVESGGIKDPDAVLEEKDELGLCEALGGRGAGRGAGLGSDELVSVAVDDCCVA